MLYPDLPQIIDSQIEVAQVTDHAKQKRVDIVVPFETLMVPFHASSNGPLVEDGPPVKGDAGVRIVATNRAQIQRYNTCLTAVGKQPGAFMHEPAISITFEMLERAVERNLCGEAIRDRKTSRVTPDPVPVNPLFIYEVLPVGAAAIQRLCDFRRRRTFAGDVYVRVGLAQGKELELSLIHISEPTRLGMISYAVF